MNPPSHVRKQCRGKASRFPEEGGPVILVVDVSDEILLRAVTNWFPLSQGLVRFDPGTGLEELIARWLVSPEEDRLAIDGRYRRFSER